MAETNRPLANRILYGLLFGVVAGLATLGLGQYSPGSLEFMRKVSTNVFDPVGQVFLRLLFFVVIPLVFASLAAGVAQLGRLDRLGPLAGRTFALFFLNMAIAVGLGLLMMNVLRPGDHLDAGAKAMLMQEFGGAAQKHVAVSAATPAVSLSGIVEMFMPKNLFGAVVGHTNGTIGDILPLILFALLVGVVGTQLAEAKREQLLSALDLVSELMTGIVRLALRLAPYAVPLMIYGVIVKVGLDILIALGVFALLGHADVDWDWGPFRHVVTSPVYHRWHHSKDPAAIDKNFAGLLPLWDILFGTYYMPKDRMPQNFGATEPVPTGYFGQLWHPFSGWFKRKGPPPLPWFPAPLSSNLSSTFPVSADSLSPPSLTATFPSSSGRRCSTRSLYSASTWWPTSRRPPSTRAPRATADEFRRDQRLRPDRNRLATLPARSHSSDRPVVLGRHRRPLL